VYLNQLAMRGFKSFADATELDFGSGTAAIVGPNGVGKSNISDAILWVLGEQSYRTLRTESSQDIIFTGTDTRRPLAMAEVSLTFDNSDGRLPMDFSEVNISRRLFRTGESQYLINKSVVRLRDVRDLLLGTGVGPDAYSVIGQGEIDAILSIRAEDRRELLEEVAGIRKYRIRRDDATRKLERTENNLTRISDIVYELSNQRAPLEREAELARRYKEFDEHLRTLDLQLLSRDHEQLKQQRAKATNDAAIAKADLAATRGKISELEAEHAKLKTMLDAKDAALAALHRETAETRQQAADARQERAVNQERRRAVEARLAAVETELDAEEQRLEGLTGQVAELTANSDDLARQLSQSEAALASHRELCENAEAAARKRQETIAELEGRRNEALRRVAALENEAAALEALQADLQQRAERLSNQQRALQEHVQRLETNLEETNRERERVRTALEGATAARAGYEQSLAKSRTLLRDHSAKREQLAAAISRLEERRDVLSELQRAYEGHPEGVKAVIAAAAERRLSGIRGVVADVLEVPRDIETAIAAGLGERLGWIITNSQADALAAVKFLTAGELGRAVFFPVSTATSDTAQPRPSQIQGKCSGSASELVKYPRELAGIFDLLLGDLAICRDLPSALEVFEASGGAYRIATLKGEVIERNGAIRSGVTDAPGAQPFGRRRELETVESRIEILRSCLTELWEKQEELDAEVQRQRGLLQDSDAQVAGLQTSAAQIEKELSHLESTRHAAANSLEENEEDVSRLQEQIERTVRRHQEAVGECSSAQEVAHAGSSDMEGLRAAETPATSLEQMRSELTERQVAVAEMRERLNATRATMQRATADLESATERRKAALAEKKELQEELAQLVEALESEDGETNQLEEDVARLEDETREQIESAASLREQVAALETSMRRLADAAMEQNERLHHAEIGLTREEGRLQTIVERLADMYDMTPEAALELQEAEFDEVTARKEARRLRAEIRQLGPVNIGAINEYERLKAREDFLRTQEDDLRAARDDLLQVIAEIDEAAEAAFMEVFKQVQVAFAEMFERLFDGGETELKLTDEEHPLEAGVEIFVRLPGKKIQHLLMLSGGERAKVAIALLFAMLKVNPSPFCLLDEIDAALDDVNTQRFGDMIEEFAKDIQFIIITHNPHTMERVDRLHGITMEEAGVSKVISVRLEDAQRQAQKQTQVAIAD
jgi:chromosome segregation protein